MAVELGLGAVILVALVLYALSGGADYGGGMWGLLASGSRARAASPTALPKQRSYRTPLSPRPPAS